MSILGERYFKTSKLEEFFRTQLEQQASTEKAMPYRPIQDYIPTSISEDVCKLIRYCQIEKGMVIIHGDAGIGKTKGAEKFVRENPAASVYIQATPSIGALGNLLKVVARALKVPECRNRLDLMLAIREKLEGTNKVIIIDEAQHLQLRALEEIRAWADPSPITGQAGIGIALIGNTEVYTRMVGKQEARFAQLFSRIRMNRYYSTHKVTTDDVKALFPKNVFIEPLRGRRIQFDTVHGVKGETHDATLYLETESRKGSDIGRVLCRYGVGQAGSSPLFDYSRKIVYVGMSRPKELLCIAIQESTYEKSKDAFQNWDKIDLRESSN